MDELLQDFVAETRETLEAIAEEIVAWEANPHDRARLDAIFRFVHTVKGSCGFLDLPRLARLSHAAEDALAAVRGGDRPADRNLVDGVLAIIDRIAELVAAIEAGEPLVDGDDAELIAVLSGEPAGAGARPAEPATPPRATARSIRVSVELLDRMMAGVSDLLLARNEIGRAVRAAGNEDAVISFDRLSAAIDELRGAVTRTRMARIDTLFAALPRIVRDLSAELGREVRLEIDGGEVELDREMIETIRDPILHIVRNALDHGIEPPAERLLAGKPRAGTLRVSARQAGNQIEVTLADDGRGIDAARVTVNAIAAGVLAPEAAARLSAREQQRLIFSPGLSTAAAVTAISGRGVGMDVVRANIERLGGSVTLDSEPGAGTRLVLCVPLTLTIMPALIVMAGGQACAVPRLAIEEIVRIGRGARRLDVAGAALAEIRGERLPLVALAEVLGLPAGTAGMAELLIVIQPGNGARYALAIEQVGDHEELVVKPAAPAVAATGLFAGVTLPEDSRPLLLLDPGGIAEAAGLRDAPAPAPPVAQAPGPALVSTLLFRDLDGRERAIRLGLVERIEDVPAAAFAVSAGRLRLARDGTLLPVFAQGALPEAERVRILLIAAGAATIAYPIAAVIDIVALPGGHVPTAVAGPVAGAVIVDGRQVELLDGRWLLAQATDPDPAADRPLALLVAEGDRWMHDMLAPLVEAAGYRVAFDRADAGGGAPQVVLAHADRTVDSGDAPVIRLTEDARVTDAPDMVWRHDRAGLLRRLGAERR